MVPVEDRWELRLPRGAPVAPLLAIGRRVAIAVAIVLVNWAVVLIERDGYNDSADGVLSTVDALYYTTVTLSTTGYGDITPVTTSARLINALVVTPMRFLFVLVLVGTTIQVLTERSRDQFRVARWRSRVQDHVVVCGPGSAIPGLTERIEDGLGLTIEPSTPRALSGLDPEQAARLTVSYGLALEE